MTKHERAVSEAVAAVVSPATVEKVRLTADPADPDAVEVRVHVGPSVSPMPSDILLRIINAAGDALERGGEDRFPAVFAYFTAGQQIEAA